MTWKFYTTSGQIKQGSSALGTDIPIGTMLPYGRSVAPAGWLLCDGTILSRTTYADLFGEIGTSYNSGGETGSQFRLPDLRGKVPVGKSAAGTFVTLGSSGGVETVTLTSAQSGLPAHAHANTASAGIDDTDHSHSGSTGGISANHQHYPESFDGFCTAPHTGVVDSNTPGQFYAENFAPNGLTSTVTADHGHSFGTGGRSAYHGHAITVNNVNNAAANAASSHSNLQPYQVVNYIIKALNVVSVELDVSVNNLLDVDTTGAVDGSTLVYSTATSTWTPTPNQTPIGVVLDFYGAALPSGFLWCDGSAIPGQYAAAISVIGANTPDLRGRVTAGLDNMGGVDAGRLSIANTLGTTTGADTHTLTAAEGGAANHTHPATGLTFTGSALATHNHTFTGSPLAAHDHGGFTGAGADMVAGGSTLVGGGATVSFYSTVQNGVHTIAAQSAGTPAGTNTAVSAGTPAGSIGGTIASSGATAGTPHNNMQPTMVVNKIIRVL